MAKEFKEKMITINLRKAFDKPDTKRAKAALYLVKKAVQKETRANKVLISNLVNEVIWEKGLHKAPRKISVKVIPEKEGVMVYMPTEKTRAKKEEKKKEAKGLKEKAEEMAGAKTGESEEKEKAKEKAAGEKTEGKSEKEKETKTNQASAKEKKVPEKKSSGEKSPEEEKKQEKKMKKN